MVSAFTTRHLLACVSTGLGPVAAGPLICAKTLGEPDLSLAVAQPVEVITSSPVETTRELVERRLHTWTSPYVRGVDLVHQTLICSGSSSLARVTPN